MANYELGGAYYADEIAKQNNLMGQNPLQQQTQSPLQEPFDFPFASYERCGNGKGDYKNRGNKKILNIKYTPDFIGKNFIIETKGRANESFPLRWKMFKKLIANQRLDPFTLYKPQNQKECDETVRLILEKLND